jgi:hypothetical protein
MGVRAGLDCQLYRNTGTYGTPVWNAISIVKDANLALDKSKPEATARLSRWKQHWFGLKSGPISFNILADPAIDDYAVLEDAFWNDTILDIAFANGAIATTGTRYTRADFGVFGFDDGQPLEDAETIDIEIDLVYSANVPVRVLVP